MKKLCPCCSGKEYVQCCQIFHRGTLPATALQLMRSRYSAYALALPEYIIDSTHPFSSLYSSDLAAWKKSICLFSKITSFCKLEIVEFKEYKDTATVTFIAYLKQGKKDASFIEKSSFAKVAGKWLYQAGIVNSLQK